MSLKSESATQDTDRGRDSPNRIGGEFLESGFLMFRCGLAARFYRIQWIGLVPAKLVHPLHEFMRDL